MQSEIVDGSKDIVLVMCFGMRSSRRASMASSQPSAGTVSSISRRTLKRDLLLDAVLRRVKVDELCHVDHAVGEHDDLAAVHVDDGAADAAAGDLVRLVAVDGLARSWR